MFKPNKAQAKTIYQIYPKSFQDSNADGWGDIQGVISRLGYLKKLGIDCIWFNPMYPSPQKDNGYDVADYRSIDSRYGTMEDFENLVQAAQELGIDIMFDMVFNHTSTEHVWFQKALAGEKDYQDYYIFKPGKAPGEPPNNWQSKFGGSAWEYVESLDKWYLHLFDVTQADLNWENPKVRAECADIINYWLDEGVKGFRFDVVNLISKNSYEDDPNGRDGRQFYTDGSHVHEYLRELNEASFGRCSGVVTIGEMSSTTLANCILYAGEDAHELTEVFAFHHLKCDYNGQDKWDLVPFDFPKFKKLMFDWQVGMQESHALSALFLNNHDQPRALSRFCDDGVYRVRSAKMLATALHMLRGTPYIFQGEEIGMTNAYFEQIDSYRDVESTNIYEILTQQGVSKDEVLHILQERSRDNSRTPMQWDTTEHAGFTTIEPWISVNANYPKINVQHELEDPDSIFYHYQAMIRLRHELELVQDGRVVPLLEDHPHLFAYKRVLGNQEMVVVANFSDAPQTAALDLDETWRLLLTNSEAKEPETQLELEAYEACVFVNEHVPVPGETV